MGRLRFGIPAHPSLNMRSFGSHTSKCASFLKRVGIPDLFRWVLLKYLDVAYWVTKIKQKLLPNGGRASSKTYGTLFCVVESTGDTSLFAVDGFEPPIPSRGITNTADVVISPAHSWSLLLNIIIVSLLKIGNMHMICLMYCVVWQ